MLGVAVRGVGAGQHVGLLGARRHAGRRPTALDVEDHRRNLGEIGQPEELLHQRDARTRGRREGARAVPAGADHHADRGQLVLGLDDGELVLLGLGIHPHALAVALECLGERRGRRDRIPGRDGGAAIDAAERGSGVALEEDPVADLVGAPNPESDRALEMLDRVVAAHVERLDVGRDQLVLALELLGDQGLDRLEVHVEQRGKRADIDDVLEQLALARVGVGVVRELGQRHADDRDVVAKFRARDRPRRVIEQVAAGLDRGDVGVPGLRVHRHHHVDAAARAQMAGFRHPHLVPGRQALDVGRKDVARTDRHAHAQDRLGEQRVRRRRAGAVDVGELDDEVVGTGQRLRHAGPAYVMSIRYFCMSQAPVGQRSAHSPQCKQTSSSLAMMRPVLRSFER